MCHAVSSSAVVGVGGIRRASGRSTRTGVQSSACARPGWRQLFQLDETERRRELGRLEVPSDLVEDEQVVVLEAVAE